MRFVKTYLSLTAILLLLSCGKGKEKFNIFSIEDDIKLGTLMNKFILSDSSGLEVLNESRYAGVYSKIEDIKEHILQSETIRHKNDFQWKLTIIRNDTIVNAFATPGGYIYIFTGLLKFLENEDQLAGVLAHEIAHADRRHSTAMLTKVYGINLLLNTILGNDNEAVSELTQSLLSLKFSRDAEEDADKHSVLYLCQENGKYKPEGATGFFEKISKEKNDTRFPEFLSTHPSPPNRIQNIHSYASKLQCKGSEYKSSYSELIKQLP